MMFFQEVHTFAQWRDASRSLLVAQVSPAEVSWSSDAQQGSLFETKVANPSSTPQTIFSVPKPFLALAETVACHRDPARWELLYRTLWRLTHGEQHLLKIVTDDDVHRLTQMQKSVSRDVHKMKAFVRFRKVVSESSDGEPVDNFVAWHRPDHLIVRVAAPFFARRFKGMHWSILTPDESVSWDQQQLAFGPGVPMAAAPDTDELEDLWKTYYASTFNPARIKIATMKREMPVRHWPTLPETELIADLLAEAPTRVDQMIDKQEGFKRTAAYYLPTHADLNALATAASGCQACDLHCDATQTVFGAGPATAKLVFVGEQPGDQEDIGGKPFIGPAGQLLDEIMVAAGIGRSEVYMTNVVKHFKYIQRGKRRLHKKPSSREIYACRPWLEAELELIRPRVLLCLGATAAQALLGRDFRITQDRGRMVQSDWCENTIATWHPSAILRMQDAERKVQMRQQLLSDLRQAIAATQ